MTPRHQLCGKVASPRVVEKPLSGAWSKRWGHFLKRIPALVLCAASQKLMQGRSGEQWWEISKEGLLFCEALKVLLAYEGDMYVVRELNISCHNGHGGSSKGPGWS